MKQINKKCGLLTKRQVIACYMEKEKIILEGHSE